MDANKSECEKCIRIALAAAQENNYEKAIKFLEKSIKLFPTEKAKTLLEEYKQNNEAKSTNRSRRNSKQSDDESNNSESQRRPSYSASSSSSASQSTNKKSAKQAEYSSDQADAVKKIKSCRDFYEILGVPKSATDADLKKAYKKLALQFHPDKNKAPGTTDAFKAIGKAFAILSDTQKRKHYDDYGPEFFDQTTSGSSSSASRQRTSHASRGDHHYNYSHWNQEEFSADELFNLFFGRNYAAASHATHRARHHEGFTRANVGGHHHIDNNTVLLQFLPIILIVVLALFSNLMIGDPLFSLQKTNKYTTTRTTNSHRVTYFVKSDFKIDNYNDLKKLERQVEDEYHNELRQSCFREKSYREAAIWRARNYGDERMIKKAMDYEMPACERINQVFGAG